MGVKIRLVAFTLLVACAGCTEPRTPSEHCRNQNAWRRVGRSQHPDPRLDALEDMRCDEMEREERREARADAKERAANKAQAEAKAADARAATNARAAAIRAAPRVPELGATPAEAKVLCEQQHGLFAIADSQYGCDVGGPIVFAGAIDALGRTVHADGYYEGADLAAVRTRLSSSLGEPEETLGPEGFRVFTWRAQDRVVVLTMYAKGVRVSVARPTPDARGD